MSAAERFDALKRQVLAQHRGFGCGPDSRFGIHLDVRLDGACIVAEWRAGPREEGPPGTIHGGVQGILVDAMAGWATAWAQAEAGLDPLRFPVTTDLRLRFRAPLPTGTPLRLVARPEPLDGARSPSRVTLGTADGPRRTVAEVEYRLLDRPWFPSS